MISTIYFLHKILFVICSYFLYATHTELLASNTLVEETKKLIEAIKKDESNFSFFIMLDEHIMKEHRLSSHKEGQPYFYTDNHTNISEILSMVLEHPDKVIDERPSTGLLKIYRSFNFSKDIKPLFIKEKKSFSKVQRGYLGETPIGPTNQVLVVIKVNKDEKNYITNSTNPSFSSAQFINAYPVKLDETH